jgi:hypothetical protein
MRYKISSSGGKLIARNGSLKFYIKEDKDGKPEFKTTPKHLSTTFEKIIRQNPRLGIRDINNLLSDFQKGLKISSFPKLERAYDDALNKTNESLMKYINYPESVDIFPVVEKDKPFTVYISGQRGAGKSFWANQFLNRNVGRDKDVILISPFDESDRDYKHPNLSKFDIEEAEDELERDFKYNDFPENSVIIFDDLEGFDKGLRKVYDELKDACLTTGRKHGLSVIVINHNPLENNRTKQSIRECDSFVVFPANQRDTSVLLKRYAMFTDPQVKEVLDSNSRWVYFSKSPKHWVSDREIRIL